MYFIIAYVPLICIPFYRINKFDASLLLSFERNVRSLECFILLFICETELMHCEEILRWNGKTIFETDGVSHP